MTPAASTLTRPTSWPDPGIFRSPIAELLTAMPKSGLDLAMDELAHDHGRHAAGPVFPCPLCFDPTIERTR